MLKRIFFLSIFSLFIISCSSSKVVTKNSSKGKNTSKNYALRNLNSNFTGNNSRKVDKLLRVAEDYMGTPYRYGGVTKSGMDCSGFITTVYDSQDINLPRRSEDQSHEGKEIHIKNVIPGDLLFFATSGGSRVSHVGIVHTIQNGEVNFIHASTSKGVMISSLNEKYWNKAYLSARRVL
ncbi:hydrolase Nlp/P60 [Elizabethkingia meningoseptica]|uniref:C40 family peptidase n=1 Tax=Elizabethkingia meningoseptica TaxID=238 RepID=UPI000332C42B|nr:C40 family peptidase [Elizabethkingia meningoseptica]AQX05974.1 hydrolase Nlp/P60 [Elizabethkingia meningoseptica]AQX48020.1 hydrolase Nlp/P60 [Elizabethkingia meningoseptica]EOR30942.1 Cell wall-associated hydrolases (invasion-associated proteins) [Elizabethkingia meningoseptica ATCC 13253 = NBRC 12535]KUY23208.1 hydrolase Nlp/P60 [Elizabethkingia meningoseptica]MCL1674981.1 C40 family peptidase [Elizabethkingia meningoseptica]